MKLDVISFNIRCCSDKNGNSIEERAPRLSAITSSYNPDVLGFQECRPAWEPFIEKYYGEEYEMFLKYRNETVDIEGSPILWRKDKFECLKTGYFWLSDTPEVESRGWDEVYNCYRMCVYVILKEKQSGETFTVMNTHFGFGDNGQCASVELLYEYSKKISDYPTFIVGDFNMRPNTPAYALMSKKFRDLNTLTSNDLSITYHNYHPELIEDYHIDYCFIDEKVKPINQKIITDTIEGKFPSDHFGLFIEIEV